MTSINYQPLLNSSTNLKILLQNQNADGTISSLFSGSEPEDVLAAKAIFNQQPGSDGEVAGPASATDNAVARFDGTTGKLIQNSVVTIADTTGAIAGATSLTSPAAIDLTLAGGSSGASLVLGQGATAANVTLNATTSGFLSFTKSEDSIAPTLAHLLNAGATTAGRYHQIIFGQSLVNGGAGTLGYKSDTATPANSRLFLVHYGNNQDTGGINLTNTGNLLIGTSTSPASYGKLVVSGGMTTSDDANSKLVVGRYSAGTPNSYIKLGALSTSLRITNAADSADLVTILNAGEVSIASTTASSSAITGALQVAGGIGVAGVSYFGGNTTINGILFGNSQIVGPGGSAGSPTFTNGNGQTGFWTNANTSANIAVNTVNQLSITSTTATFAGAVTVSGGSALVQSGTADPFIHIKVTTDNAYNPYLHLEGYNRSFYVGVRDTGVDGLFSIASTSNLLSPLFSISAASPFTATFAGAVSITGNIGFYGQAATAKPTGVLVTAAAIHAALVTLNLIAA